MRLVDSITKCVLLSSTTIRDKVVVTKNKWDAKMTWRCRNNKLGALVGGEWEAEILLGRFRIMHDVYGSITFAREIPNSYAVCTCTVVYAIDSSADFGVPV